MPLTIYRRGRIWHYRGTVAGRKLRGSTRTADKKIAQRIAAETEARHWRGHLDGPASVLTFANAVDRYLDAEKPERFILKLADYWQDTAVKSMTPGAIQQSSIDLYPGASNATRNRAVIIPTVAIINHAAGQGLCQSIKVKKYVEERREREPATWDWVQSFMASASPHMGALACFMFLTGARVGEAIALKWENVELTRRRALIRQTKVGSERWAHLPEPLFMALAKIPDRKERVFKMTVPPDAAWKRTAVRAGIEPLSFHACRHGFATAMLRAGVDPISTAKAGGWKSPKHVFDTYGHAIKEIDITERILDTLGTQSQSRMQKTQSGQEDS